MFRRCLLASIVALLPAYAVAAIDPFEVAIEVGQKFKQNGDDNEAIAKLSASIREATVNGELTPDFVILYAMYSDTVRVSGNNPAFALQIAEQGLSLALKADPPDTDAKNTILISRAYALADLGRYEEAVEALRITAVWMGERFGQQSRDDLEKTAKDFAAKAAGRDKQYSLPSIVTVAVGLIDKAKDAINAGDMKTARELASRALLPAQADVLPEDLKWINGQSYVILGISYRNENPAAAIRSIMRAVDLVTTAPWDRKGKPQFDPTIQSLDNGKQLLWEIFSNLAAACTAEDHDLNVAALSVAADFAYSPDRRFSLLVQQAGVGFRTKDYAQAVITFTDAAANARAAGDESNALLAEFYAAIARLYTAPKVPNAPELIDMQRKAERAAASFGTDLPMADYVLSTATRMSFEFRFEGADAIAVAYDALDVFMQRERSHAADNEGQVGVQRERRGFLEAVMGASYVAGKP